MTISEPYHAGGDTDDWLADTASVGMVILELVDEVVDLDLDVARRRQQDLTANRGYPTRSSGGGGSGGPTNLLHNFATGEDGTGESIPLDHGDPTGEAAVRDPFADDLGRARRLAFEHACNAMRELEAAKTALARTRPAPKLAETERDRDVCWPCADAGIPNSAVLNDGAPKGIGRPTPRCRNHYEFHLANGFDAPVRAAEYWQRKDRVSPTLMQRWIDEEREERRERAKRKRGKGRR